MTAPPDPSAVASPPAGRNLWPIGIGIAFAVFITGTVGLIVLASFHRPELVTPDYYERDLRYQQTYDSRARAQALGPEAEVAFESGTRCLRVRLPARQGASVREATLHLYRPAAADADRTVPLTLGADGHCDLDARDLAPGLWRVRIEWKHEGQAYLLERPIVIPPPPRS